MAIEISEEMVEGVNTALANRVPCILATAGSDGWPSMGFRGSMMVFNDGNLAYWERSNKDGLAHIKENPQVLVMFRNPETRQAWKFYGHRHRSRGRRHARSRVGQDRGTGAQRGPGEEGLRGCDRT